MGIAGPTRHAQSPIADGSTLRVTPVERVECADGIYVVDWRLVYPLLFNCYLWTSLYASAKLTPPDEGGLVDLDVHWDGARREAGESADRLLVEYRRALWQRRSRMDLFTGLLKAYQSLANGGRQNLAQMRSKVQRQNLEKIESIAADNERMLAVLEGVRDLSVAGMTIGATFLTGPAAAAVLGSASSIAGVGSYVDKGDVVNAVLTAGGTLASGSVGRLTGIGSKMILSAIEPAVSGVVTYRERVSLNEHAGVDVDRSMLFLSVSGAAATSTFGSYVDMIPTTTAKGKAVVFMISAGLDTASGAMSSFAQGKTPEEIANSATSSFISKGASKFLTIDPMNKMLKRGLHAVGVRKSLGDGLGGLKIGNMAKPSDGKRGGDKHDALAEMVQTVAKKGVVSPAAKAAVGLVSARERATAKHLPLLADQSIYDALVHSAIRPAR